MDQGLNYHWLLGVPPSLHNGCFTLSSPATVAEGLCLHNSGYLHWARKPISLTHTRHLIVSFISGFHLWTLWLKHIIGTLSYSSSSLCWSYKMAAFKAPLWHINYHNVCFLLFLGTLLRCLLLKCWQVLCSASEMSSATHKLDSFTLAPNGFRSQLRDSWCFGAKWEKGKRKWNY